jgi:two-component system KDP operon response regulator KdpE
VAARRLVPPTALGGDPSLEAMWTVLLVDDEPSIVRGVAALLRRGGFVVLTAHSGSAAVRIVAEQRVDLAVIDYHIPDWRGDVVLAAVAAYQPHLSHRTVFITGDIGDAVRDISAQTGCPLLFKPFDIEELEWHLLRLLSNVQNQPPKDRDARGCRGSYKL